MRRRQISKPARALPRFSRAPATACHKSPRGLLKTVPAVVAAGLSAPALHHQRRHGLGAGRVPGLQWCDRYALPGQGCSRSRARTAKQEGKPDPGGQARRSAGSARPVRPQAASGRSSAGTGQAGRRWRFAARRGRTAAAATPSAGASGPRRGAKPTDGQTPAQAATEPQIGCQAEAEQARQARGRRRAAEDGRAGQGRGRARTTIRKGRRRCQERYRQERYCQGRYRQGPRRDKPEAAKPAGEGKSETAKVEAPKESVGGEPPALRPDPVPPVTPAPPASTTAAAGTGTPEPAASPSPAVTPPTGRGRDGVGAAADRPGGTARAADLPIEFPRRAMAAARSGLTASRVLL